MSFQLICALLTAALLLSLALMGLIQYTRGERCSRCGRRGYVVHVGTAIRCRLCASQWRAAAHDTGGGWG